MLTPLFAMLSLFSLSLSLCKPTDVRKGVNATSATRASAAAGDDAAQEAQRSSVTASARVSDLWADMNASTSVSQRAADRTAKVLSTDDCECVDMYIIERSEWRLYVLRNVQYLKGLTSKKQPKASKKRKLYEFQVPVLSLDVTKSRGDMRSAGAATKVDQVVKFAGVEYRYSGGIGWLWAFLCRWYIKTV